MIALAYGGDSAGALQGQLAHGGPGPSTPAPGSLDPSRAADFFMSFGIWGLNPPRIPSPSLIPDPQKYRRCFDVAIRRLRTQTCGRKYNPMVYRPTPILNQFISFCIKRRTSQKSSLIPPPQAQTMKSPLTHSASFNSAKKKAVTLARSLSSKRSARNSSVESLILEKLPSKDLEGDFNVSIWAHG